MSQEYILIPKCVDIGKQRAPGPWWAKNLDGDVFVMCPNGHRSYYELDDKKSGHTIDKDGKTSPSTVCGHKDCKWHVYTQLQGWS